MILVVQPLPGIGDMIWHLPHIRALSRHFGGPVTLLAKPRSRADEIFVAEDTVEDIIWVDRNPEGRQGEHDGPIGLVRLIRTLRARRFDAAVLLHHSPSLAFATMAAGIPVRHGYGVGPQRLFLNRSGYLPPGGMREHQFDRATIFLQAAGVPINELEPYLSVSSVARETVGQRLEGRPRPIIAVGIGSSEPSRQWGSERFTALVHALLDAGWPSLALIGGPAEQAILEDMLGGLGTAATRVVPAMSWHLTETAALLAESAFYVGNNTGAMNMAAAVGLRTYALFGTTPPFRHSSAIVPIVSPSGGPIDGMARVSVEAVLEVVRADRGGLGPAGSCQNEHDLHHETRFSNIADDSRDLNKLRFKARRDGRRF
jgi:heptosyltransferase-2